MKKILLSITVAALSHPLLAEEMPFVDNDGSDFLRALSNTEEYNEPRIETLVFEDTQALAVLSPQEMEETEGAFNFSTLAAGTVLNGAASAGIHQVLHYGIHGKLADAESTLVAFATGSLIGARASLPAAAGSHAAPGFGGTVASETLAGLGGKVQSLITTRQLIYDGIAAGIAIPYSDTSPDL